jgi:LuxR family maltose regulon positive regulatory protein
VSDLLGAIASIPGQLIAKPSAWPLSEREHDVWRHLGTRLSTREIAARLGLSHNTVKTHMRSIYRKLGVRSRQDAVARGRSGA